MVRVVDDYEWIKAERRQDPADLAWHSTAARQAHCDSTPADHVTDVVQFDPVVKNLGVVLDNQLSMGTKVTAVSRSCVYQLRQLHVIQ